VPVPAAAAAWPPRERVCNSSQPQGRTSTMS
jgi:hypothetical protein